MSAHRFYSGLNYTIEKKCAWCGQVQLRDDVMTWRRFTHYRQLCEGNPPVTDGFPSQRASNKVFGVSLISLNKLLSEESCTSALRHHGVQVGHIIYNLEQ